MPPSKRTPRAHKATPTGRIRTSGAESDAVSTAIPTKEAVNLGIFLKEVRTRRGQIQKEFAADVGMDLSTLAMVETGNRRLRLDDAQRIVKLLNPAEIVDFIKIGLGWNGYTYPESIEDDLRSLLFLLAFASRPITLKTLETVIAVQKQFKKPLQATTIYDLLEASEED